MKTFVSRNMQFILMMASWIIAGYIMQEIAIALVLITFILLKYKNRYSELVIAFCFLLLLSDNRHHEYDFAKDTKDVVLLMLSAFALFDRKNFPVQNTFFYPFALFLLYGLFISYRHPDPVLSFQKALSYTLMFAVIPKYFDRLFAVEHERFFRQFILFFSLVLITGISLIFWRPEEAYLVGRFNGLFGNPNGVGTYCTVITLFLAVTLFHNPNLFSRGELYIIIASIAISVLLCGSRNAIFSILIFLFFRRFYRISYWYGFIIVIVSAMAFQIASQYLPEIILNLGLGNYFRVEHLNDGSGRLIAWHFGWQEIKRNLLLGRGFAYDEYYFFLNKDFLSQAGHQGGVHNSYLSIWLNTGAIGLALFLFGLLRTFFRASATCYLALPALFTILFSITFESWLMGSLNPFTIVAIMTVCLMQFLRATDKVTITADAQKENRLPVF